MEQISDATLGAALKDADGRVRRYAVTLAEPVMAKADAPLAPLLSAIDKEQDAGVLLQWSLSLGGAEHAGAEKALELIASKAASDMWLAKSLALVNEQYVGYHVIRSL